MLYHEQIGSYWYHFYTSLHRAASLTSSTFPPLYHEQISSYWCHLYTIPHRAASLTSSAFPPLYHEQIGSYWYHLYTLLHRAASLTSSTFSPVACKQAVEHLSSAAVITGEMSPLLYGLLHLIHLQMWITLHGLSHSHKWINKRSRILSVLGILCASRQSETAIVLFKMLSRWLLAIFSGRNAE